MIVPDLALHIPSRCGCKEPGPAGTAFVLPRHGEQGKKQPSWRQAGQQQWAGSVPWPSPTLGTSQAGDICKHPQPTRSCPKQHHFPGGEHPAGPQALPAAGLRDATARPEPAFREQLPLPGLSPGHTCSDLGFPRRSPNAKLDLCTRQHLFLLRLTLETFPSAQLSEPDCIFL